jgi:microcystin-dependent protein
MSKNYMNDSQASEIVKYISDTMKLPLIGAGGGFAPIGTINFFDASVAPQGWLICDGSTHNISDYPELATFYASVHGSANFYGGDGTTTFAVPDLRGEFLRGTGTNGHANQGDGANVGVHQDGTIIGDIQRWASRVGFMNPHIQNPDKSMSITGEYQSATRNNEGTDTNMGFYTSRPTNTSFLICVKATVSGDANAHHYSTDEQIVGMTEDGETIYEKTIKLQNVAMNYSHSISFAKDVIDCKISITLNQNQTIFANYYYSSDYYATFNIYNGAIQFDCKWSSYQTFDDVRIVLQYTKTS